VYHSPNTAADDNLCSRSNEQCLQSKGGFINTKITTLKETETDYINNKNTDIY